MKASMKSLTVTEVDSMDLFQCVIQNSDCLNLPKSVSNLMFPTKIMFPRDYWKFFFSRGVFIHLIFLLPAWRHNCPRTFRMFDVSDVPWLSNLFFSTTKNSIPPIKISTNNFFVGREFQLPKFWFGDGFSIVRKCHWMSNNFWRYFPEIPTHISWQPCFDFLLQDLNLKHFFSVGLYSCFIVDWFVSCFAILIVS